MKLIVAGLVGVLALSRVAHAQSPVNGPSEDDFKGYVEVVAQSAFGNVTSQSFGFEGGIALTRVATLFAEFGMARDTSPKSIGQAAQVIANSLGAGSGYTVKQPVQFGIVGFQYAIPFSERFHPYFAAGGGLAKVKRDVTFSVGGADVTSKLDTYGVVLGTDLAGTVSKPMLSAGGGVIWNVTSRIFFDASYRFGRIMTDTTGTNLSRAGAGIGFGF